MRTSFKVLTYLIGSVLVISLFIASSALRANEEWWEWKLGKGKGKLENVRASVWVGALGYDPETGWTSSSHWFQMMNHLNFDFSHDYEFQHGVSEILRRNNRGDIIAIRPVDNDQTFAQRLSKAGETYWHPGTQGVDCNGERRGEYHIQAYTAVRSGADLNVQMDAELMFRIKVD